MEQLKLKTAAKILYDYIISNKKISRVSGIESERTIELLLNTFAALNVSRAGQLLGLQGDSYNIENYEVIEALECLLLPKFLVASGDETMPNHLGVDFRNEVEGKDVMDFLTFNGVQRAMLSALKMEVKSKPVRQSERFVKMIVMDLVPNKYHYQGRFPVIDGINHDMGYPLRTNWFVGEFTATVDLQFIWKKHLERSFN